MLFRSGLVQVTRQRVRPEMNIVTVEKCPSCGGSGEIRASIVLLDEIENNLNFILNDSIMEIQIEAVQIAEFFNIRKFRAEFQIEAFSGSTSEIFYAFTETNRYLYVFDYGVVVFANYDLEAKRAFIDFLKNYASNLVTLDFSEEYKIETNQDTTKAIVKNASISSPNATIKEEATPIATPIPAGPDKPATIAFNAVVALPVCACNL